MCPASPDPRAVRTQNRLRGALLDLLRTRSWDDITVAGWWLTKIVPVNFSVAGHGPFQLFGFTTVTTFVTVRVWLEAGAGSANARTAREVKDRARRKSVMDGSFLIARSARGF